VALLKADPRTLEADSWNGRFALLIAIGCIPGGLVGLAAQGAIDDFFHSSKHQSLAVALIAIMLAGFAVLLWLVDRAATHRRELRDLELKDSIWVGVA